MEKDNFINMDFTSLYPNLMNDFTKDKKLMSELKRLERKRKLKRINQINNEK